MMGDATGQTPIELAIRVADHQIAVIKSRTRPKGVVAYPKPTDWEMATSLIGIAALADRTQEPRFRDFLFEYGERVSWQIARRPFHADDHAIGAVWLWCHRHGAAPESLASVRRALSAVHESPPDVGLTFIKRDGEENLSQRRWSWCDALFMAPPVWFELADLTGEPAFAGFAIRELAATTQRLFDPDQRLFHRDSRHLDLRDENGAHRFWSRGNGWVLAGLARFLPALATHPEGAAALDIYDRLAHRLADLQHADGHWQPSLLTNTAAPVPESSGTGLILFGLAKGVAEDRLDPNRFAPIIDKGWQALSRMVDEHGVVGYVQRVSDRPDGVEADDTHFYGTGAFLLAATAVAG